MGIRSTAGTTAIGVNVLKLRKTYDTEDLDISGAPFFATTWNSADKASTITLSNGDLTTATTSGAWQSIRAVSSKSSGKYYFEVTCTDINASGYCMIGICTSTVAMTTYFGSDADGHAYYALNGQAYNNNAGTAYGDTYTDADIISVAVDLDNDAIYFAKNGVWQNSSDPESGASRTGVPAKHQTDGVSSYFPALALYHSTVNVTTNFGASTFTYDVPTGYTAGWST
jgi:hypothetical protein